MQTPPHPQTPIQTQLHSYHVVPWRYINLLTERQQQKLFDLLSAPSSKPQPLRHHRRVVFTHVTDCHLHACLRAIASAVTYAHQTSRLALIFVDQLNTASSITRFLHVGLEHAMLTDMSMLLSVPKEHPALVNVHDASLNDWAEFSVIDAAVPPSVPLANLTRIDASNDMNTANDMEEATPIPTPKIGNTKIPATLDNLAAIDTHVFLNLSEVVWCRYAPRTIQELYLSREFTPTSRTAAFTLQRASLLGRHASTRVLYRTEDKLHHVYHVPTLLIQGLTPLSRKLLLLKLQAKTRRGVRTPGILFVHAQYGLGNRLRAVGSAMAFARRTDRVLVVIWVPDQHLNCLFTDLFVSSDEFVVADAFPTEDPWPFVQSRRQDDKMKYVKWYNYMRVNGKKVSPSSRHVYDDEGYHIYVSTCYVIQSPVTPYIIRTSSSYWHVLKALTPQISVVRLVERFASYPMSRMIGIHIRGKSIKTDISGVRETDYTEESSRTTDYWRNLTQVETFIAEMKRQAPDQLFYVAADQKEVFARLEKEFPSRVFFTPRKCDSRERDCLPFALADILLLAKCSSLRGSYWSSFTELSTRIGGARFLLAGVDFGRPGRP